MSSKVTAAEVSHLLPEGYRKRSAYVERVKGPIEVDVASYWDGGSKDEYTLVTFPTSGHCVTGCRKERVTANVCPLKDSPEHKITVQPGQAIVRHGTFCGQAATANITIVE